jgi:hypothetical protein
LAAPIAVNRVPFVSVRNNVAVELGSDRRFKPLSEFTYTSRVAGAAVAVDAGVGVSAIVDVAVGDVAVGDVAVGGGVLVGVAVGCDVTVAAGRAVFVATAQRQGAVMARREVVVFDRLRRALHTAMPYE